VITTSKNGTYEADRSQVYRWKGTEEAAGDQGRSQERTGHRRLAIGGGVAANTLLRSRVAEECDARGLELKIPPPSLCTDNAAMIASAARYVPQVPYPDFLAFDAFARSAA